MEYAAREIYFKSPREDTGGAGSGAVCKLNHSHSPLLAMPLPPLNFPLTLLFKIHGLSYLFLEMIIIIPQSLPKVLKKLDYGTLSKHVHIKNVCTAD